MKKLTVLVPLATLALGFTASASAQNITAHYDGQIRDRVRFSETGNCLTPDGTADGTFTVQFKKGTGSHHITRAEVELQATDLTWNTTANDEHAVLGVARTLDGALLNAPGSVRVGPTEVDFTVADGASIKLFAAPYNGRTFTPSYPFTVLVEVDGQWNQVDVTVPYTPPVMTYEGKLRDRVGLGEQAMTADGKLDGVFSVTFGQGSGVRKIVNIALSREFSSSYWDTIPADNEPILGIAHSLDGPLLNSADGNVSFFPQPGETYKIFVSDHGSGYTTDFSSGWQFRLAIRYDDSTTDNQMLYTIKADVFGNISTRGQVSEGDSVMIGGFIISGNPNDTAKKLLIRAIGPSLNAAGLAGLRDPVLEVHDSKGNVIINDDWQAGGTTNGQPYTSQTDDIKATKLQPSNAHEAAMIMEIPGGATTAILRGKTDPSTGHPDTGTAVFEVYDLQQDTFVELQNISTRGKVGTGNDAMIAGVIVSGQSPQDILIRAIGPSLAAAGLQGTLQDPFVSVTDANGALVATNDDWKDQSGNPQHGDVSVLPPSDDRESAVRVTLTPGGYTALVRAADKAPADQKTGIAVVEAYHLQ